MATPFRMAKSCGYFAILAVATDLNMRDGKPREHEALTLNKMSTYWEVPPVGKEGEYYFMASPVNMRLSPSMKFPFIESGCHPLGRKANIATAASPANTRLSFSLIGECAETKNPLFARNVQPLGGIKKSNLICESRYSHWCGLCNFLHKLGSGMMHERLNIYIP